MYVYFKTLWFLLCFEADKPKQWQELIGLVRGFYIFPKRDLSFCHPPRGLRIRGQRGGLSESDCLRTPFRELTSDNKGWPGLGNEQDSLSLSLCKERDGGKMSMRSYGLPQKWALRLDSVNNLLCSRQEGLWTVCFLHGETLLQNEGAVFEFRPHLHVSSPFSGEFSDHSFFSSADIFWCGTVFLQMHVCTNNVCDK